MGVRLPAPSGHPRLRFPPPRQHGQLPRLAVVHVNHCCRSAPPAAAVNRQVPEARPPDWSDKHPRARCAGLAQNGARYRYLQVPSAKQQADHNFLRLWREELGEGRFSPSHYDKLV